MVRRGSSYDALCIAIKRNDPVTFERILNKSGALFLDENWGDYFLLVRALQRKQIRIAILLLDRGCRVNIPINTNIFCTPLYYAVKYRHLDLIGTLLRKDALINGTDFNRKTSLHLALKARDNEIMKLLLSKYIYQTMDRDWNNDDYNALIAACLVNCLDEIEQLLKLGLDVNKLWPFELYEPECTALHFAVKTINYELIDLLLAYGASVDIRDAEGFTPLHLSLYIRQRHPNSMCRYKVMQKLLSNFKNTGENKIDKNGVSYFHIACTSDNSIIIENLLKNGVNINSQIKSTSPTYSGYTPLHLAIEYKNESIVELLLHYGAKTTIQNTDGHTSLHLAFFVFQSNHDFINSILKYVPTNVNFTNQYGLTHFHIAAAMNDLTTITKFIEAGLDINSQVDKYSQKCPGYTPLHFAVAFNKKEAVECLLQNGANVNIRAEEGFTSLHLACQQDAKKVNYLIRKSIHNTETGFCMCFQEDSYINAFQGRSKEILDYMDTQDDQIKIVDLLMKYNSNVNSKDDNGRTPLFYACVVNRNTFECKFRIISLEEEKIQHVVSIFHRICQRRHKIVEILFKYKPDICICDKDGNNILHYITINNGNHDSEIEKIAEMLINSGADLKLKNRLGSNALHIALEKGFYGMTNVFLQYDIDINVPNSQTLCTPLHYSVLDTTVPPVCNSIIEVLVQKGAEVNVRMIDGRTPVHIAASNRYTSAHLTLLLEANADIELKDAHGRTALHLACINRNSGNVDSLLECGADINVLDNAGKTAFYYFYQYQTSLLFTRELHIIYNVFQHHITRLKFINLHVSNENIRYYTELKEALARFRLVQSRSTIAIPRAKLTTEEDIIKRCDTEVEQLKLMRVSTYTTMYDMLFKDLNEAIWFLNNGELQRYLQAETFDEDFMMYGYLLKLKYKQGLERNEILEPAKRAMENLVGEPLIDGFLNPIFKYLKNTDLRNIIKAKDIILPKSTKVVSNQQ